jgi:hypothetical protein
MSLASALPNWTILVFALLFWGLQRGLRPYVPVWSFITLPATALHELAHALVGFLLLARPSSWSLWPRRVSASSWRLGSVGFLALTWWNGGAIALAPLVWLLFIISGLHFLPALPTSVSLQTSIVSGISLVWLWIAVAPGRSDWSLARRYWLSSTVFLVGWALALYGLALSFGLSSLPLMG